MKSRAHQLSKYRPGEPAIAASSSVPLPADASPVGEEGR